MTATATKREWDVDQVVRLQDEINPDTGRFWSLPQIKEHLGINVSKVAMSKGARDRRHELGLGQPGISADKLLPWEIPARMRSDYFTIRLRLWAHDHRGDKLSAAERGRLDAFKVYLGRMGEDTVVGWDPSARGGLGGYFFRPRKPHEATVYGLMLKPGAQKV